MSSKIKIVGQNLANIWHFRRSFLSFLGVRKVIFWNFSKLLMSCLSNVTSDGYEPEVGVALGSSQLAVAVSGRMLFAVSPLMNGTRN